MRHSSAKSRATMTDRHRGCRPQHRRRDTSRSKQCVSRRQRASSQTASRRIHPVRRTILGILASAILASAPTATGADTGGWQEAKWGMTPAEVQKILSYPTRIADLAKVCGTDCNEGAALELDDYQLDGQHFVVRLWFTKPDIRLQAVSLYAKQLDDANGNEAFSKIKKF